MFNTQFIPQSPLQSLQYQQNCLIQAQQSLLYYPQYYSQTSIPNSPAILPQIQSQFPMILPPLILSHQNSLNSLQQQQQCQMMDSFNSIPLQDSTLIENQIQKLENSDSSSTCLPKSDSQQDEQPTTPLEFNYKINKQQEDINNNDNYDFNLIINNNKNCVKDNNLKQQQEEQEEIQDQNILLENARNIKNKYRKVSMVVKNKIVHSWHQDPQIIPIDETNSNEFIQESQFLKSYKQDNIPWIKDYMRSQRVRQILELEQDEQRQQQLVLFGEKEGQNVKLPQMPKYKSFELHKKNHENNKLVSKFHNKNKLFINTILRFMTMENLEQMNLPRKLREQIFYMVEECKKSGVTYKARKRIVKTDMFNHSHYRLLFFSLSGSNIKDLLNNEQDIKWHKKILELDIREEIIEEEDILYVNFLKKCIYEICNIYLREPMVGDPEQQKEERLYEVRAFQGLEQLIQGNYITKF